VHGLNNIQTIIKKIESGYFSETSKDLITIDAKTLDEKILFELGYDNENIITYSFAYYLILQHNTKEGHVLSFSILSIIFHFLWGHECSLHHIQNALELDPHDIRLKETLLFLNGTPPKIVNEGPQRVITNKEAREIAQVILKKDPNNQCALDKLSWLDKTQENDLPPVLPSDDISDTIQQTISAGRFLDMQDKIDLIDQATLKSILFDIAKEEENICAYAFPWFLMLEHGESALYHELAADVLIEPFLQLVGAFYAARYHITRALELDPNNKQLQEKEVLVEKEIKSLEKLEKHDS
jgi:tetratricopeptide (TPR) repeat protein